MKIFLKYNPINFQVLGFHEVKKTPPALAASPTKTPNFPKFVIDNNNLANEIFQFININ